MTSIAVVYVGLLLLAPLCASAQRHFSERPVDAVFARDRLLDWSFWLITPVFTGVLTRIATLGLFGVVVVVVALPPGPLAALPIAAQVIAALLLADVVGYLTHRARHSRWLWVFHRLHHSPRKLDWLAAARLHPIDDLIDNVVVGGVLLLLGVRFEVFAALGPLLLLHTLFVHMNVTWDLGPLRRVLVSPALHRWHHSVEQRDVNFAGMFAFIDVAFGTFWLPADRRPGGYGVDDDDDDG